MLYVFGFVFVVIGFLILILDYKYNEQTDDNVILYSLGIFTISEGIVIILIKFFIIWRF